MVSNSSSDWAICYTINWAESEKESDRSSVWLVIECRKSFVLKYRLGLAQAGRDCQC